MLQLTETRRQSEAPGDDHHEKTLRECIELEAAAEAINKLRQVASGVF